MSATQNKNEINPADGGNTGKGSKRSLNINWGDVVEPKISPADKSPGSNALPVQNKETAKKNAKPAKMNEDGGDETEKSGAASIGGDPNDGAEETAESSHTAAATVTGAGIQSRFAPPSTIDPEMLDTILKNLFEKIPLSYEKKVSTVRLPTTIDTFLRVISGELKIINPGFRHVSKEDLVGMCLEVIIADDNIRRTVLVPVIQSLLTK